VADDARGGSIKRAAYSVGEGSIAISFVHKVLEEYEQIESAQISIDLRLVLDSQLLLNNNLALTSAVP
jgi:hypothetical protein